MEPAQLKALLDRAAGLTVAVVGDLMLDRYVYGEVSRISPEAPIPVLRGRSEAVMLGAAGNVARNVTALGGAVRIAGALGRDGAGEQVLDLFRAERRTELFLSWREDGSTTSKTRFVAGQQQLLRLDDEDETGLAAGDDPTVETAVLGVGAVLVSDYAKGFVTGETMAAARAAGAPVVVDPKGTDFARYGGVDLLKPNAGELAAAVGLPVGTDAEAEAALAAALARFPARAVLVTRGAAGMSLAERGRPVLHVRAHRREVFDVSGAGDTGLAALGLALAAGASLAEAVALAVAASGVAVGKPGTAVVTAAEVIEAEAVAAAPHGGGGKVCEAGAAAEQAARWREAGLRVGFTNGCFDVLHAGHVAYLAQARAWCDRLVVAVNTDRSVRALKGEGRPANALADRAAVLTALAAVDLVTAFDTPTPLELIAAVRPDVLVKGADYTEAQVVGADLVRGWGGEVRLAPLVEGRSTTATLARLRAAG